MGAQDSRITSEALLTHPRAFALGKYEPDPEAPDGRRWVPLASPVQRGACRVADGLPLGELAHDPDVVAAMGGPQALADLPVGLTPKELYLIGAIRAGKSLFCAVLATKVALTIDLSHLGMHEVARVSVVSLSKDQADVVLEHLLGAFQREDGILCRFLVGHSAERVLLRRPDGRLIMIRVAAGKRGGDSLVSRWTVAAIFDEACRMLGKSEGVVNFDDMRRSVIARLTALAGAMLVVVSAPASARGPVYKTVEAHWGRPTPGLVVVRATGPQLAPTIWTPEVCEAVRRQPDGETSYLQDVLGHFVDPDSDYFTATEIDAATRASPLHLEPEQGVEYFAATDTATRGNAWTLVIMGKRWGAEELDTKYFVAFTWQRKGTKLEPLKAEEMFTEIAGHLKRYGLAEAHSDHHGSDFMRQWGAKAGVEVVLDDANQVEKDLRYVDFKARLVGRTIELAPEPMLKADLLSTRRKARPGIGTGMKFDHPVTHDGRHADFAPAVVLGLAKAVEGPSWVYAMKQHMAREATEKRRG